MKRIKKCFSKFTTKKKIIFSVFSLCLTLTILFGLSKTNLVQNLLKMAGIYSVEERVIEFQTDGFETDEAGNIKITESVSWISNNEAKLNFDIESIIKTDYKDTDYLILVDNSNDMENIEFLKENLLELSEEILKNSNNRISLMTFNDNYQLLTEFNNDSSLINEKINGISLTGECNYQVGFEGILEVLSNYTKDPTKQLNVLFITNSRTKNGNYKTLYNVVKEMYPYTTVNAIQYDLGNNPIKEISVMCDNHYIAQDNTLEEILINASLNPDYYEEFILEYLIDSDFYVEAESDIKVPFGDVELIDEDGTQKVYWNLSNILRTGSSVTLNIILNLDSKYNNTENYYATNQKLTIDYKLVDEEMVNLSDTKTAVIKNGYKVIYDTNAPTGCNSSNKTEVHNIESSVPLSDEFPMCEGYVFAGWELLTENIQMINSNTFIMPENNVDIKGTWQKVSITKATEGIVVEKEQITAPTISGGSTNWQADSVTLSVTEAGTAESGVSYYEYYETNDASSAPDINTQASGKIDDITLTLTTEGIKYYYFRTVSTAGWKSEWSNVSVVKIDNTTPSCNISLSGGTIGLNNWYTSSPTVKMSTSVAGLSGISYGLSTSSSASYSLNVEDGNNGTTSTTAAEGSNTYHGYVRTGAGKTATCTATVNVDSGTVTAPTINGGSTSWKSSDVTLSVTTAGKATSGLANYEYYKTTSTTAPTSSTAATGTTSGNVTINTNGTTYVYYRTVSKAGQKSAWTSASTVKLDKTTPTCSISVTGGTTGSNSWYTSAPTIKVTTSTAGVSGLSYGLTTSTTATYSSTATSGNTGTTSVTASSGSKTYYGYVKSGSGKTASCSKTVKLETSVTAPTVTGGSTSWRSANVTLSVSTAGTATSGVANYEYYTTTSTTAPTTSTTASGTTSNKVTISANGTTYVYYRTVSTAGKKSSWTSASIVKIDKTTPAVSLTATASKSGTTIASGSWSSQTLNYVLTKKTSGSSGYTIYYCVDNNNTCTPATTATSGATISAISTTTGTYYFRYYIKSGAGLSSSVASYTAKVDVTPPTVKCTASGNSISATCTDSQSGCVNSTSHSSYSSLYPRASAFSTSDNTPLYTDEKIDPVNGKISWSFTWTGASYKVYMSFYDAAGNTASCNGTVSN